MYPSFYSFKRGWSFCGVWDRRTEGDKDRFRQIVILSHNFFLLTIARCVIFKTHLALLLLLGHGCSTGGCLEQQPQRGALTLALTVSNSQLEAAAPSGAFSPTALAFTLAITVSNCNRSNCHRHLHILFHNAHLLLLRSHDILPLIYTGASLIDGSVKSQYVTLLWGWIWH